MNIFLKIFTVLTVLFLIGLAAEEIHKWKKKQDGI